MKYEHTRFACSSFLEKIATPGGPQVSQKVDNATQWIAQLGFPNAYPQVSDLIVGYSVIQRLSN